MTRVTTPENEHAAVRLPKRQKLFIVKPQEVVEDQQTKRSSRPQSPVFPLKIGEDQKRVFTFTESCFSIENRQNPK